MRSALLQPQGEGSQRFFVNGVADHTIDVLLCSGDNRDRGLAITAVPKARDWRIPPFVTPLDELQRAFNKRFPKVSEQDDEGAPYQPNYSAAKQSRGNRGRIGRFIRNRKRTEGTASADTYYLLLTNYLLLTTCYLLLTTDY